MAKLLSYILMLIGIVVIVVKLAFKQVTEKIPYFANLNILWVVIAGIVLIAIGFLLLKGGRQAAAEVPIYQGGKIIGYRRR